MKVTRKELDRHIKVAVKGMLKEYGYKMRSSMLYKKSGDYFISILFVATDINNNEINAVGKVKPYFLDDVFWDVFQMSENMDEPMSLRANGAFTVKGLQVCNQHKEIESYDEVEGYVKELLRECTEEIKAVISQYGTEFRKFISYSKNIKKTVLYNSKLVEMLLEIKEKNYVVAKNLAGMK
ncbi:MAG: hypothetical protein ACK5KR_00670 [Breznakia sp.]